MSDCLNLALECNKGVHRNGMDPPVDYVNIRALSLAIEYVKNEGS